MFKYVMTIQMCLMMFASSADASQLSMKFKKQQQSNWCWAATSVSVINYLYKRAGWLGADTNGEYVYQCDLASQYNAASNSDKRFCCRSVANAAGSTCNQPGSVAKPLQKWSVFDKQINGIIDDGVFLKITSEINNGRPVIGSIKWSGTNVGHAIIAYGIGFGGIAGGQAIYINDPTTGNQVGLAGKDGLNNYGSNNNGYWRATYVVKNR